LEESAVAFRGAIRLESGFAKAHHNLAVTLAQQGKSAEAIAAFREALRLNPAYAEAQYNLGNTLGGQDRRDEAIACYREAVRLRPDYVEALNNLGLALTEAGSPAEAAVLLRQAVRVRPDFVEGHNNLGLALADLGRLDEAVAAYEQALRLRPGYADAHANLGSALMNMGRVDEAVAAHDHALRLEPDAASAHWNRSLALLLAGDFAQGCREYEWRWKRKSAVPRPFRQPRWDGASLAGRSILLWCEQGLGDAVQFVRYASLVKERGGRVILECPGTLTSLFRTVPGVDQVVAEGTQLPGFDVQAPLMSLPAIVGTTSVSDKAQIPYLSADPQRTEYWHSRLDCVSGLKIGIAWQGNPRHRWDRHRSIPLARFIHLASVHNVRLISLQKGPGTEQLREVQGRFEVIDFGNALDQDGAFVDTAAIISCLDLVVTTDSAVAHLAGALGARVWLALSTVVDWRWLLERDDTPWYPSMRLFRQRRLGDWSDVFERMAAELTQCNTRPEACGAVSVAISPGELLDKVAILQIKQERIADAAKLRHVVAELEALSKARMRLLPDHELTALAEQLRTINEKLWDVEDLLRVCEQNKDFGPRFVELARSVYRHNDARADIKHRINTLLKAPFAEQKSYSALS
jgi:Flp pilus assembly protein TadD